MPRRLRHFFDGLAHAIGVERVDVKRMTRTNDMAIYSADGLKLSQSYWAVYWPCFFRKILSQLENESPSGLLSSRGGSG